VKREVCFLIGKGDVLLWSDVSTSPLALPDSRERWEQIWQHREQLVEIAHSHPLGPEQFSAEDSSTMRALDDALGPGKLFSLVTPRQYLLRGPDDIAVPATPPAWVRQLRLASGMTASPLDAWLTVWKAAGPTGDERHRARLESMVQALHSELTAKGRLDLLFVCTHNSRRSHMAQLLGLETARWVGFQNVRTFSGGTEVTTFNPRAIAALRRVGFDELDPAVSFSKKIEHPANPTADFIAVMTCSEADAACPVVSGATRRVSLPYEDPKVFDGTPEEHDRYDERVEQIGRDLLWVFSSLQRALQKA
jgi:arsenate reductase (thioredoxin)